MAVAFEAGVTTLALFLWWQVCKFLMRYLWKPLMFREVMDSQGIRGPPVPFFDSSPMKIAAMAFFDSSPTEIPPMEDISHDILAHVLPRHARCIEFYGAVYMNWWTREPRVVIAEPELIKEVLIKQRTGKFGKSPVIALMADDVFGHGVFDASGEAWVRERRLVSPAFHADKIKTMFQAMLSCTTQLLEKWELLIDDAGVEPAEIDVHEQFIVLTSDILMRTSFGSSYDNGGDSIIGLTRSILRMQAGTQAPYSWIPLARFIPIRSNIERWRLRRELNHLAHKQMQDRKKVVKDDGSHGKDLLGMLLDAETKDGIHETVLIGECKTFYATGHTTLTSSLSWTMLLLAMYPTWQAKARAEVDEVFNNGPVDATGLNKLKIVEMILRESMRLYPSMPLIPRLSYDDCMVGGLFIPKGMGITIPVVAVHHDPKLWGADVHEFNPNRFALGSSCASKHPMAFMPFSFGGRVCIGQAYAQMESKVVIASILQRFEMRLSPSYRHNPQIEGTMFPRHGMPLLLKKL